MTALTHDTETTASAVGARRTVTGLSFAVVSATAFALSGPLARGPLDTGWSAGAVVLVRVALAALVLAPVGALALRGRWRLLRRNAGLLVAYGTLAVAGAQFCYFSAVSRLEVAPALLLEYTAPVVVVLWLWVRRGDRPSGLTLLGIGLASLGLVLVLDVLSGADLDPIGVLWGLGAMVGLASYFLLSADESNDLPPVTLAAGGLIVGTVVLGLLGAIGLLPLRAARAPATYDGLSVDWWVPLVVLGLVTAAVAYATGVEAARRLGSRLASFVALLEVLVAIGFAWLLLGELPGLSQLLGGILVLLGIIAVKLGRPSPAPAPAPQDAEPTLGPVGEGLRLL